MRGYDDSMGRPPLNLKSTNVRLPEGLGDRIDKLGVKGALLSYETYWNERSSVWRLSKAKRDSARQLLTKNPVDEVVGCQSSPTVILGQSGG
jgi:hypothetical protein